MRGAEHLAVLNRTFAAFAPRGDVVGVHFVELIDSALVRGVPKRAERTVGLALGLGCLRLPGVCQRRVGRPSRLREPSAELRQVQRGLGGRALRTYS